MCIARKFKSLEQQRADIRVIRSRMALAATTLAEKELLAAHLRRAGPGVIELAEDVQFGRRRKIQQCHEFGHEVHLAAAFEDVDTLFRSDDGITVEVRRPLLQLRERVCEKGFFGQYMMKTAKEGPNNGKECLSQ